MISHGAYPFSLGSWGADNLAGVSPAGHGPYLGNFFDDLARIAKQVGVASDELSRVASGERKVATVPTNEASLIIPIAGQPVATAIPLWALGLGIGGLAYLALRKRR